MILKSISVLLLLFGFTTVNAQQLLLYGDIAKHPEKTVYLSSFYGTHMSLIDSTVINEKGVFNIRIGKEYLPGFYRLSLSVNNYIDIIINGKENIAINCADSLLQQTRIISSVENTVLEKLKRKKAQIRDAVKQLTVQQSYLDKGSNEYRNLQVIKDSLNSNFNQFSNELLLKFPNTFCAKTTRAYLQPKNQSSDPEEVKKHFFDQVNFSDPSLIRTTLLPNLYMKYLERHTAYNETGFKSTIDLILAKAKANDEVYQLSLEFFMDLFGRVGPELIFEYLVENYYLTESCGNETLANSIALKANKYVTVRAGAPAQNLQIPDKKREKVSLKSVWEKNEITLLYFWASFCHFCEQEHPNMKRLYDTYQRQGFEICGISLDTTQKEWYAAIKKHQMDWVNLSELQGWKSPSVDTYRVNKTPTIYLIGKNGTILAKGLKGKSLETFVELYLNKPVISKDP